MRKSDDFSKNTVGRLDGRVFIINMEAFESRDCEAKAMPILKESKRKNGLTRRDGCRP